VQKSLIPDVDQKFENVHIAAKSIAAREIGGEFHSLDFHDKNIAVALCDIHEKGVPGGLNASLMSGALKAFSFLKGNTPAKIIRLLDKAMKGVITDFKKVSFFYGIINAHSQNLLFVNSGVAYPILVRRGTARYLKFRSRSLGDDDFEVKQVKLSLEKGDYFVILSDSLVNFKNSKGQILGLKKIMDFIQGDFTGPLHLINSLVEYAGEFMGGIEMREDVSIIAFNIE
jgi:serine phosphatase RsbU (regulator of sigma subunit)